MQTEITPETNQILIDLLEFIKETEQDYLFIVSPYVELKEHKENFNYVSNIVNQYGYNFIDANEYTDEMGIDFSKDLYHEGHLNPLGAEKYTDYLSKFIIENYDIPKQNDNILYYTVFAVK